jgi:hypothetical protein
MKLAETGRQDLQECIGYFRACTSIHWAGGFLDYLTDRVMRSRLEPLKYLTPMQRRNEELLLNGFKSRREVEVLNYKIRMMIGFITVSEATKPLKRPHTTTWARFQKRKTPIDSANEAELLHQVISQRSFH